jgi:D-3-phosphoglycerate dehydrogenase
MLMLAVARRAVDSDAHIKQGGWWPKDGPRMVDLAGKTALVVGYGRIGSRVAAYARAFHMKVMVHDPLYHPARIASDGHIPARDLRKALTEADVVTLHCPLTPETRHLMDEAAFAALKPGAILVNTARGPIVKQEAVVAALHSGRLMGFAFGGEHGRRHGAHGRSGGAQHPGRLGWRARPGHDGQSGNPATALGPPSGCARRCAGR